AGPHTRLCRRVVLQSGAYNLIGTVDEADATVERLERHLGTPPASWRSLSTEQLREAQDVATPRSGGVFYRPVADGVRLPAEPAAQLQRNSPPVGMLIGSNAEEYGFFWGRDERFDTVSDEQLLSIIGRWHTEPREVVDRYRRARQERGEPADNRSIGLVAAGDVMFRVPSMALAGWHSSRAATFAYRFDWASPLYGGLIGAAHVLEVPFVFGTYDHPTVAAYTGFDVRPDAVAALSEEVASAWVRFASTGDPGWPRYDVAERTTRIFDAASRLERDPAGPERQCWDPTALRR
ncbi:MAG: carboxylesterase family protein, partial [Acidimicrobiales bacterium]